MLNIENIDSVIGEKRFIDKSELINAFNKSEHDIELSDPLVMANWIEELRNDKDNKFGVYCLYNSANNEPLYIGKSKNIPDRVRQQFLGSKSRKNGLKNYTRLFLGVIKREDDILAKDYYQMSKENKEKYNEKYNEIIFSSGNRLKICFTDNHIDALVLEESLFRYYVGKNQCKYNYHS
jgi:hypothetical protein